MEPLFGTTAPPWPAMAPVGFGWPGLANRQITPGGFGAPQFSQGGVGTAAPVLAPDLIGGVSVPTLLVAVAMRRGQPLGPTSDQEIEDFVYDALELLPGTNEVEVRVDGARVTLTGAVQHKRLKRDAGEIAWGIPTVNDVQNNVTIATRRRVRNERREAELQTQPASPGRK